MSSLPALLPITPFTRPVRGEVTLPGSKSITNRALLLAALCDTPVTLTNALFSEDTEIMAKALNALGIKVTSDPAAKTMQVTGQGGKIPADSAELFLGNAGTAARFLTALCAAAPRGVFKLDGVPQMRKRPMKGLLDALRTLGADIRCPGRESFLPIEIHARGLAGGDVVLDARESSQMLSALLMIASLATCPTTIRLVEDAVRWPFVQMTIELIKRFGGAGPTPVKQGFLISNKQTYRLPAREFLVETDATAASYFIALPIVAGGQIRITDYHFYRPIQGDVKFAKLLHERGLISGLKVGSPTHWIARGQKPAGFEADFGDISDTFLTLAALAPLLEGPTRITGIAHTRKQETNRVAGAYNELKKLGQGVEQGEDWLKIIPRPLCPDVEIETYGDHRFAMSFAILGCHDLRGDGRPWLCIRNPGCCAKTFPNFFEILGQVRENSHSRP
jgi:3-phosphoshikimate 1-carboxyvinyltransferase